MPSNYDTQVLARVYLTHFWACAQTSGITLTDTGPGASNLTLTPNSGTAWTGGTLGTTTLVVNDTETAITLNGTSGYLQAASPLITAPDFALDMLIKCSSSASLQALFFNRNGSFGTDVYINADGSITWYSGSAAGSPIQLSTDPNKGSFSDGSAHQCRFCCFVTNGQYAMQVWRDNVLLASALVAYNPVQPTSLSNAVFGTRFGGSFFGGQFQKIAIYNQVVQSDIFADRIPFVGQSIPLPATYPKFTSVQYVWPVPGDPARANFDNELALCRSAQRRWALIGDSVSTIPSGGGRALVPQLIIGLGRLFGGIAGTPLTSIGAGVDGFCIQGGTAGGGYLSPRIDVTIGAVNQLPPGLVCNGLQPLASMGGEGPLNIFTPENVETTIRDVYGLNEFSYPVNIEIVGSAANPSGEFAYQNETTNSTTVDYFNVIATAPAGITSMGLNQTVASGSAKFLTQTIPNWSPGVASYIQARIVCQDGFGQADFVGMRVINPTSVGVVLDDYSAGGYTAAAWFGQASGGTGSNGNCQDFIVSQAQSHYIVNLGRNDAGGTVAQFIANLWSPNNPGVKNGGPTKGLIGEIEAARNLAGLPPALYTVIAPPAFRDDGSTGHAAAQVIYDQFAAGLLQLAQSFPSINGASRMLFINNRRFTHNWGWTEKSESIAGVYATTDVGVWTTGTAYVVGNLVAAFASGQPPFYVCILGNTADSTNQPGLDASSTGFFKYWRAVKIHTSDGTHDNSVGGYKEAVGICLGLGGYGVFGGGGTTFGITGTAQGGTTNTITLASSDAGATGVYVGQVINLTSGTGKGQAATVTANNGTTKVVTVLTRYSGGVWITTPDNTTGYLLSGQLVGGTSVNVTVDPPVFVTPG